MKTYGQFCPVAQALEVLAERWTLLVVRELLMGSSRFGDLHRGVPRMSRTLLAQRLRSLQDAAIVERREGAQGPEYVLTEAGRALMPVIESIGCWGKAHARFPLEEEQLDAELLMWDLHRRLERERLPHERTVVRFDFTGTRRGHDRIWLVLDRDDVDVCVTHPGFEEALEVDADLRSFTEVWRGERSLQQAIREKRIRLSGASELKRAFPGWLRLSVFADA